MLPQISTPDFETTIPSTGQKILFRPFLVREEKKLLMAMEAGEESTIVRAVNDILQECIISDIDVKDLSYFDFEYLFLQLRMKSVGEVVDFGITHTCGHTNDISLNLEEVKVEGDILTTIQITDDIGIQMKYPNVINISKLGNQSVENIIELFCDCVVSVYDNEKQYDFERDELKEWIENLPQKNAKQMINFFTNMPKLSHTLKYECAGCKEHVEQKLEGLQSFFQ